MEITKIILLVVLVALVTYILFTPDNFIAKFFAKYCCDEETTEEHLSTIEHIKIPKEKSAPTKKKRVARRKKKVEATDTTKPKKKRKYTRRKKTGVK